MLHSEALDIPSLEKCRDIVNSIDSFFEINEKISGVNVVSFNYRLSNYSAFTHRYSRNMRGVGFNADTGEILFLPMFKFFNYLENDYTSKNLIDSYGSPKLIMEKADGSLIIMYKLNGNVCCRTQGSCCSDQANAAYDIIKNNTKLKTAISNIIDNGWTPLFEYVSPNNTIVVIQEKEELVYLGSRNMTTGQMSYPATDNLFNTRVVKLYNDKSFNYIIDYCEHTTDNIEGFVLVYDNGEMIKIKSQQYYLLHKIKSNCINEKDLVEEIINRNIDDYKAKMANYPELLEYINNLEKIVIDRYNIFIKTAENFYNTNKELSRKDYAIKANETLLPVIVHLAILYFVSPNNPAMDKFNKRFIKDKLWM